MRRPKRDRGCASAPQGYTACPLSNGYQKDLRVPGCKNTRYYCERASLSQSDLYQSDLYQSEWCPGEDLNLYDISATSPLNWRVYHSTTWAYDCLRCLNADREFTSERLRRQLPGAPERHFFAQFFAQPGELQVAVVLEESLP